MSQIKEHIISAVLHLEKGEVGEAKDLLQVVLKADLHPSVVLRVNTQKGFRLTSLDVAPELPDGTYDLFQMPPIRPLVGYVAVENYSRLMDLIQKANAMASDRLRIDGPGTSAGYYESVIREAAWFRAEALVRE